MYNGFWLFIDIKELSTDRINDLILFIGLLGLGLIHSVKLVNNYKNSIRNITLILAIMGCYIHQCNKNQQINKKTTELPGMIYGQLGAPL